MKKHLLFAAGLLVSAPLAFAQVPATPATPPTPSVPSTDAPEGAVSGTVKKDKNSLGGSADTKSQSGKLKGHGSQKGDFAAFDVDGDGQLSKDEAGADTSIDFAKADKNHDGRLSNGEYQAAVQAGGTMKSNDKGSTPSTKP